MYVGRIVAVGMNQQGGCCALYRVSSRSFPNRMAKELGDKIAIVPKPGHENDIFKNPYIAYNCLTLVEQFAVATNGSHTDFIGEKIAAGYSPRDALVSVLHAMDYEHDHLRTPRIAAVADRETKTGWLGIVTAESLDVRSFAMNPGKAWYVATYEHTFPNDHYADEAFDASTAADACQYIIGQGVFADLERPISAACAVEDEMGAYRIAIADA